MIVTTPARQQNRRPPGNPTSRSVAHPMARAALRAPWTRTPRAQGWAEHRRCQDDQLGAIDVKFGEHRIDARIGCERDAEEDVPGADRLVMSRERFVAGTLQRRAVTGARPERPDATRRVMHFRS